MSPGKFQGCTASSSPSGPVPGGPSSSFSTRTLNFLPGGEAHSQQPPPHCPRAHLRGAVFKKTVLRLLAKCPLTYCPPFPLPSTVSSPGTCLHRLLKASEIPALMLPWHWPPCSSVLLLILPRTVDSSAL